MPIRASLFLKSCKCKSSNEYPLSTRSTKDLEWGLSVWAFTTWSGDSRHDEGR